MEIPKWWEGGGPEPMEQLAAGLLLSAAA